MRCEECGRVLKNAQMWQLGGDTNAPSSTSMRQLCWECREQASAEPLAVATAATAGVSANDIVAQAYDVLREYDERNA